MASSSSPPSPFDDTSHWVVIYPAYLDSKKTVAQGRRISISHACENPTSAEIGSCCAYLNLPHALELEKAYPRDSITRSGRVRVKLKNDDGTPVNSAIRSRKDLMLKVAELVPKHVSRAGSVNANSGKTGKSGKKKK